MNTKLNGMQRHFIRFLLGGKIEISNEETKARQHKLGLDWLFPPFVVVTIAPVYKGIDFSIKDKVISEYEQYTKQLLKLENLKFVCITDEYNNLQIVVSLKDMDINSLDDTFIHIHEKLYLNCELELFIGIGGSVSELRKISLSSADAHQMLAYKYQYADRGVININNIVRFQHNSNIGPTISFERVIGCFQDGDLGRMEIRINELVEEVRNRPNVSKTSIRRTLIELLVHILNVASYVGVDVDDVLDGRDPYYWILEQNHTEVITEWIMEISSKLLSRMNLQIKQEEKDTIRIACDYIEDELGNPMLGLQSVSDKVRLTSTYFSQLFKAETGVGINAYIADKRIGRAKYLLENTQLKLEDIAKQTGFMTASYFSRAFKKYVGITPGQYRKGALPLIIKN